MIRLRLPKLPPGMSSLENDMRADRRETIISLSAIAVLALTMVLLFVRGL